MKAENIKTNDFAVTVKHFMGINHLLEGIRRLKPLDVSILRRLAKGKGIHLSQRK